MQKQISEKQIVDDIQTQAETLTQPTMTFRDNHDDSLNSDDIEIINSVDVSKVSQSGVLVVGPESDP